MMPTDHDALTRALDIARKNPAEAKRIDERLAEDGDWFDLATSAAFHCQVEVLHLKPSRSPPIFGDVEQPRIDQQAAGLLRRLLDAGLSRYEPDPLAALEQAEKRRQSAN